MLSSVCLSSVRLCALLRRLKFLATYLRHLVPWPSMVIHQKILRRSSQGNTSVRRYKHSRGSRI